MQRPVHRFAIFRFTLTSKPVAMPVIGTGAPLRIMKKIHFFAFTLFLGFAACLAADPPATAPKTQTGAPAEKTSFQEVTSHLDPGGNLYLYLGTEQWVKNLSAKISGLRGIFSALPSVKDEDR